MAEYIEYHPLKFWLDPASIAEIVAHIQTYLVANPINSTTEIETIIHDYLIAHPELIGGVDSVNGQTGEVVLTADNISGGENVTIKDVLDSLQDQIDDIVASIPSDYQQLIDDVSDLKSAIDTVQDILVMDITATAWVAAPKSSAETNVQIGPESNCLTYVFNCKQNEYYDISCHGEHNRFSVLGNSAVVDVTNPRNIFGNNVIYKDNTQSSCRINSGDYSTIFIYLVGSNASQHPTVTVIGSKSKVIEDLDLKGDAIESAVNTEISDKVTETETYGNLTQGRLKVDGTTEASTSEGYTEQITVTAGEIISVYGYYLNSHGQRSKLDKTIRYITAYKSGVVDANAGLSTGGSSYTVPSGVTSIVVTINNAYNAYNHNVVVETKPNGIIEYILRQRVNGNPLRYKGELTSGTVVNLPYENAQTDKILSFTGLVTGTFGTTYIGTYHDGNIVRPYIEVTATQVKLYSSLEVNDRTFNHGLTIANDFQLILRKDRNIEIPKLIIQSNGERWTAETGSIRIGDAYYGVGAKTDGAYSDCTFTVSVLDLDKPVWVFGDSWVSLGTDRWVGNLIDLGYDAGFMLSGRPGETSLEAVESLKTLIAIEQPKMIVWCMGMNDPDTDNNTPNADWLSAINEVKSICTKYDITLVMCTIPTVPSSQGTYSGEARNNNAKNAYIIASGYRYVDQVTALGADKDGNWISGYWHNDSDHTHPSEAGARALMVQFMADVPEMFNAYTK